MKICIVGVGSIGRRHIKNLHELCSKEEEQLHIHTLRSGTTTLPEDIQKFIEKEVYHVKDLDAYYDAVFISNPTYCHYTTLKELALYTKKFFIEKPLFENAHKQIEAIGLPKDAVCYVSCPLRYMRVLREAKEMLKMIKPYSVRAICSSYLPDWRVSIDYRKVYSAIKEQGGGVCLDLIHEWDYLIDLFGMPKKVEKMYGKYSHLEIDSEDLAIYLAAYEDKLVELHLDYFGRRSQRKMEIYAQEGMWLFDLLSNQIKFEDKVIRTFEENPNEKYLKELDYFLKLPIGIQEHSNTLEHALSVMKIVK